MTVRRTIGAVAILGTYFVLVCFPFRVLLAEPRGVAAQFVMHFGAMHGWWIPGLVYLGYVILVAWVLGSVGTKAFQTLNQKDRQGRPSRGVDDLKLKD